MAPKTTYKQEYCEKLIEHMASGYSFESFAGSIKTTRQTLYSWVSKFPEFQEAKDEAFCACQLFYEQLGLAGQAGKIHGFNAAVWIFNMKNRFGWRDRQELEVNNQNVEIVYKRKDDKPTESSS